MADQKEKQKPIFRVNEKTRTVRAYNEDLISEEDIAKVKKYNDFGYKVILLPKKPKNHKHIKNDMIKYLEGNIDDDIYKNFIDGVEKGKDFLTLQWGLIKAIEKKENKKNLKPDYIEGIINQAKARENNLIENAKKQAEIENKKNKNKDTSNEGK